MHEWRWISGLAFRLASGIWSSLTAVVRFCLSKNWLKSVRLDARVVSVGNIQVGGTGKTPLVALIAQEAIAQGLTTCILSRGYRSRWGTGDSSGGGIILPHTSPVDPALCGDEAALLHDLVPQAYLGVGANRVRQYRRVQQEAKQSIDLVILDDGFQHWRIQKDVEIVALTLAKSSERLFRDFSGALKNADLLVWTQGQCKPDGIHKPRVVIEYRLPHAPSTDPYWLVTGVANGLGVRQVAGQFGYRIVRHFQYKDHAAYTRRMVRHILEQALQNECKTLITGKDWVKWRSLGVTRSEVTVIEPELIFKEGRRVWSQVLWAR